MLLIKPVVYRLRMSENRRHSIHSKKCKQVEAQLDEETLTNFIGIYIDAKSHMTTLFITFIQARSINQYT